MTPDERFKLVSFNPAEERAVGLTTAQVAGKFPEDFLPKSVAEQVNRNYARCVRERGVVRYEEVLDLPSGRVPFLTTLIPIAAPDGRIHRIIGVATDISERKAAEEALRVSELRFRSLFEQAPVAIIVSRNGAGLYANPAFLRMLGLDGPEAAVGRPIVEYFAPEYRAASEERTRRRAQGLPVAADFESVGRRADGSQFPALVVTTPIQLVDGPANLAFVSDITERRRSEDGLRDSEAKYRSLVEHAVFGIYRSTLDGRLLAANSAMVAMLGYASQAELLEVDMARNLYADPTERQRLVAQHRDAARIDDVEVTWKRKDGRPITVRLSGRPTRTAEGELEGFEMVVEDVTERRALEAQLRQAQKMEAVGQLAGGVAHDFNNLLTAILASCALLNRDLPEDSPLRDDAETICSAAQRGAELTQELLSFGRRRTLDLHPVSLGAVAATFVRLARRVVPEHVEIVPQIAAEHSTIRADTGALDQILMNLVTNARDAMPQGGKMLIAVGQATLDEGHCRAFGWGRPGAYVTLAVSDTGTGMDAETRQRIFEPFFTTKPPGQGTGLGMSVVYGLIKQHDGFVHVTSEVGRGTTVRLYFPAAAEEAVEPVESAASAISGGTETILLVEDDEAVRGSSTRVLERYGYRVRTASDGGEALRILKTFDRPPDLIISDVVMPHTSGPQLLSKLREAGPVPKVIFTSGYTGRDALEHAQLEPGVPFLSKPWAVDDLLRKVREVLDAPAPA